MDLNSKEPSSNPARNLGLFVEIEAFDQIAIKLLKVEHKLILTSTDGTIVFVGIAG